MLLNCAIVELAFADWESRDLQALLGLGEQLCRQQSSWASSFLETLTLVNISHFVAAFTKMSSDNGIPADSSAISDGKELKASPKNEANVYCKRCDCLLLRPEHGLYTEVEVISFECAILGSD